MSWICQNLHLLYLIVLLLIAGAVAGGIYYYNQNVTQIGEVEEVIVDEVIKEKEEVTEPTLAPEEVDLSIFSINVLNGSGVAGEAEKVATTLSNAGFASPNADNQNYTDTIVGHKATVPQSVIDELVSSLESNYTVEISNDTLGEDGDYDFIVTVGERS